MYRYMLICCLFMLTLYTQELSNTRFSSSNYKTDVEPTVLVNPMDSEEVVVAWIGLDTGSSDIEIAASSNTGSSWYRSSIPNTENNADADPVISFTPDGKVHIIHLSDGVDITLCSNIFTSTPTWNGPYEVSSSGDKPWLSSDLTTGNCSGNLYSTFSNNGIYNKDSDDNGNNWNSIGTYSSSENFFVFWSTTIVDTAGSVYMFWGDYSAPYTSDDIPVQDVRLYFTSKECNDSSLDTPATDIYEEFLAPPLVIPGSSTYCLTTGAFPAVAYDNSNDIFYIAIQTIDISDPDNPDKNILILKSDDKGDTWDDIEISYLNNSSSDQVLPWISVDENGYVYVVHYEYEVDSDEVDIYMIGSYDNADSFALGPVQLNEETLDKTLCDGKSEYIGISALNDNVFVAWVHAGELNDQSGSDIVISHYEDVSPDTPTNLTVSSSGGHPLLEWDENSDIDLSHYTIWAKYTTTGNPGFWHGVDTTASLTWIDTNVAAGYPIDRAYYKITANDFSGKTSDYSNTVDIRGDVDIWPIREFVFEEFEIPDSYELDIPYPNPFNPTIFIPVDIPETTGNISLTIYDINGKEIEKLINGTLSAGYNKVTWDGSNYPGGLYFVQLIAGEYKKTQKIMLLK